MKRRQGQTTIEYIIIIGFVVMAVYFMGPAFKRGTQSLIKVTADQIGNQAEADQTVNRRYGADGKPLLLEDGEDDSFMAEAHSQSKVTGNRLTKDRLGVINVQTQEMTELKSSTVTDMGFTRE